MKINKLNPQGFCSGVKYSLKMLDDAINNPNTKTPIYLLGSIIHNKKVTNEYIKKGLILLDDKNKSKEDLLNSIDSGTVIFSAHGVGPKVYEIAKHKKLDIVDATCPNVRIIHNKIKEHLNKGYDIIYIGVKNHAESKAVLDISNKIHFITNLDDLAKLKISNDLLYVTNQTTLSILDIDNIYQIIKDKYPNSIIDNKICLATTKRQQAIINMAPADLLIVVGDISSSNTNKLKEIGINIKNIDTILCEDFTSLDIDKIKSLSTIAITSGASTPSYLVDEIIEKINK